MAVAVEESQDEKCNLLSYRNPDVTDLRIQRARINGRAALRRQPDGLHYRVHAGCTGGQQPSQYNNQSYPSFHVREAQATTTAHGRWNYCKINEATTERLEQD